MSDLFSAPGAASEPDGDAPSTSRSRTVLLGGGLVASLVLGGWVLLGPAGAAEEGAVVTTVSGSTRTARTPTPSPSVLPEDPALGAGSGRNPFAALYVAPAATPGAATTGPVLTSPAPALPKATPSASRTTSVPTTTTKTTTTTTKKPTTRTPTAVPTRTASPTPTPTETEPVAVPTLEVPPTSAVDSGDGS